MAAVTDVPDFDDYEDLPDEAVSNIEDFLATVDINNNPDQEDS